MHRISSGSIWEQKSGYSRAVVAHGLVFVSATAATDQTGAVVGKGNVYEQTKAIFSKMVPVLKEAGASLKTVVQTRLYVVDIAEWEAVCRAHSELFASNPPAMSLVHVKPFLDPDMLVEVELIAAVQ
jgi:enamine deaminase RidA (YjgF/YER057c/UK114 family)